ncbi:unnamed protein product, partial [Durusdinium trenchii]
QGRTFAAASSICCGMIQLPIETCPGGDDPHSCISVWDGLCGDHAPLWGARLLSSPRRRHEEARVDRRLDDDLLLLRPLFLPLRPLPAPVPLLPRTHLAWRSCRRRGARGRGGVELQRRRSLATVLAAADADEG